MQYFSFKQSKNMLELFSVKRMQEEQQDREDIKALTMLQSLTQTYIPWTSSAIRPSALVLILNDIVINDRKIIVELGGGITTLVISKFLSTLGDDRKLITVDHDQGWLKVLQGHLKSFSNSDYCELVHANLVPCDIALENNEWYDIASIKNSMCGRLADILIVDGPPAYMHGASLARYPALPLLFDSLSDKCSVFLDDGNRKGESKIASMWEQEHGMKFNLSKGNVFFGSRGDVWNIL